MPNDVISIVNISEKNRASFVNRQDLISYIDNSKRFFKRISAIPSKDISNKIFTELKLNTPDNVIKTIIKDGAYIVGDKLVIVSKNVITNKEYTIMNGVFPYPNVFVFDTSGKKHLRNLLNKIPEQYIEAVIGLFRFIVNKSDYFIVNYLDSVSKKNFIDFITNNYSFAIYMTNKELMDNYKKYADSSIVVLTEYPDEGTLILDKKLGIKKENGITYQSLNRLKIIYLKEDEEFGVEYYKNNDKYLVNDILYLVSNEYKKSSKKIKDIIKYLDDKIW
jgi:hypothetical protein